MDLRRWSARRRGEEVTREDGARERGQELEMCFQNTWDMEASMCTISSKSNAVLARARRATLGRVLVTKNRVAPKYQDARPKVCILKSINVRLLLLPNVLCNM